ncbi:MAG: asparagine synthase-related protein, partial [Gemmatimonadales bacterium]
MNPFYTVVALDGGRVGVDDLMPALTALERADQNGQLAVVEQWGAAWVPATERGRPAVLHKHGILAVGDVRLTNRGLLAAGRDRAAAADLALVVDRYRAGGFAGLAELVGDFAFVLWDAENHRLVAARDGVGIRDLYFRRLRGRLAVASHLDAFEDCELDAAYLAEFAAGFPPVDGRTPYQGVERVHPGGYLLVEDGRLTHGRYWRAEDYRAGQIRVGEREAVAEFGRLFEEAVAAQTDDGLVTWAQLSGGLDSSSVVGMVETRAARGLGPRLVGTQTVVDGLGDGDETRYSDAVVDRYGLRN